MSSDLSNDLSYILNHLGEERSGESAPVAPPIHQSANFSFATVDELREAVADELKHPVYTRGNNPTTEILRRKLAALERTEDALVFSSGSAAIAATLISQLKAGDHVVCVQKPYNWTNRLLVELLGRYGVRTTFVDATRVSQIEAALTPATRLIYLESPNSWTFELQDLAAVARLARARGILTALDNTWSTPLGRAPASFGIDFVIHSASKYIGGHSDVIGGVVCASRAHIAEIFRGPFMILGATLSPHDGWLLLRGLRTLAVRRERVAATTRTLIDWLDTHPKVVRVLHPHAASFPQRELALEQHPFCGGLFTIELRAKAPVDVDRFVENLETFLIAASWGGHESLVLPATLYHSKEGTSTAPLAFNLVRVAIGLEDAEFLRRDLEQALAKL